MDAQEQFEGFLRKYQPGVAAEAKKSLAKLRKLIPNAIEMVYDNYNALLVGFCPGLRPSEAIISIAVMPEWVSLCFLQGAGLPDPEKRLEGSGNVARHIKMKEAALTLDEPAVKGPDRRSAGVRESSHPSGPEAAVHHQVRLDKAAAPPPQRCKI
jgi:hypothetical protein